MICAAGFHCLGLKPKFWSIQYGTDEMAKLEPRPGQLFVDITPPKERWEEWKSVSPVVLDHHETVEHVVKGLNGVYATNEAHSGAMLAYEHVLAPVAGDMDLSSWKEMANLSMIRDTWKKNSPQWREACALANALMFEGSRSLVEAVQANGPQNLDLKALLSLGEKIVQSNERRMEKVAGTSHHEVFLARGEEYKVSFFNCTEKLVSDIANFLLEKGSDISIGYFWLEEDGQNKVSVSIRTSGKISASKMAILVGGGGHERAAGFRIPDGDKVSPSNIYRTIANLILDVHKM